MNGITMGIANAQPFLAESALSFRALIDRKPSTRVVTGRDMRLVSCWH